MKLHPLDLSAVLTTVIGVAALTANSVFQSELTALFGSWSPKITAFIGLTGLIAPILLRVHGAPSSTPFHPEDSQL